MSPPKSNCDRFMVVGKSATGLAQSSHSSESGQMQYFQTMTQTHWLSKKFARNALAVLAATYVCTGCVYTPEMLHENFNSHMKSNVGKVFTGNNLNWMRADRFVKSEVLADGVIEREYIFHRSCKYYFSIHPTSNVVLSWRYVGTSEDCSIPL